MLNSETVHRLTAIDTEKYENAVDAVFQDVHADLRHHVKSKVAIHNLLEFFTIEGPEVTALTLALIISKSNQSSKSNQESTKH